MTVRVTLKTFSVFSRLSNSIFSQHQTRNHTENGFSQSVPRGRSYVTSKADVLTGLQRIVEAHTRRYGDIIYIYMSDTQLTLIAASGSSDIPFSQVGQRKMEVFGETPFRRNGVWSGRVFG